MKNYQMEQLFGQTSVIEIPSQNVIHTTSDVGIARKLMNQLNGGRGFNGWTPSFLFGKLEVL